MAPSPESHSPNAAVPNPFHQTITRWQTARTPLRDLVQGDLVQGEGEVFESPEDPVDTEAAAAGGAAADYTGAGIRRSRGSDYGQRILDGQLEQRGGSSGSSASGMEQQRPPILSRWRKAAEQQLRTGKDENGNPLLRSHAVGIELKPVWDEKTANREEEFADLPLVEASINNPRRRLQVKNVQIPPVK